MRVGRLRKIKRHILEEPLRVNMGPLLCLRDSDLSRDDRHGAVHSKLPSDHVRRWPSCNTVGCLSGWEILLYGDPGSDMAEETEIRLDLPNSRLFYVFDWPRDLGDRLRAERPGTPAYAEVVAEAIEDYIRTDGWQEDRP